MPGEYKPPPTGDRPAKAKRVMERVYEECRSKHPDYPKSKCAKIGWGAVHNAGYKADEQPLSEDEEARFGELASVLDELLGIEEGKLQGEEKSEFHAHLDIEPSSIQLEKADKEGARWFEGWGSVMVKDKQNDLITKEELERLIPLLTKRYNRFFDSHTDLMLGEFEKFEIREKEVDVKQRDGSIKKEMRPGLWFRGHFYNDYAVQREKWDEFKKGLYKGFSLRGGATGMKMACEDDRCTSMMRVPTGLEITAFSIVRSPANQEATPGLFNRMAKSDKPDVMEGEPPHTGDKDKDFVIDENVASAQRERRHEERMAAAGAPRASPEELAGVKKNDPCPCASQNSTPSERLSSVSTEKAMADTPPEYVTKSDFEALRKEFMAFMESMKKAADADKKDPEKDDDKVEKEIKALREDVATLTKALQLSKGESAPAPPAAPANAPAKPDWIADATKRWKPKEA